MPVITRRDEIRLTLSLGLAAATAELPDFDALLECADRALYRAKAAGRNRIEVY